MRLPPVAILAGGRGTRLGELVRETPKPLLEVAGEPFLYHQLRLLREQGAERIVVCVGYLGERIESTVGSSRFGLEIAYSYDEEPGTAEALRKALPLLGDEFLVLYGDTYLQTDYGDVVRAFRASGRDALMTVLSWPNGNAELAGDRVARYEKGVDDPGLRWIDWGLEVLRPSALSVSSSPDLAAVLSRLASAGRLAGYEVAEPFHEIGTPERLRATEAFLLELSGSSRPSSRDGA